MICVRFPIIAIENNFREDARQRSDPLHRHILHRDQKILSRGAFKTQVSALVSFQDTSVLSHKNREHRPDSGWAARFPDSPATSHVAHGVEHALRRPPPHRLVILVRADLPVVPLHLVRGADSPYQTCYAPFISAIAKQRILYRMFC